MGMGCPCHLGAAMGKGKHQHAAQQQHKHRASRRGQAGHDSAWRAPKHRSDDDDDDALLREQLQVSVVSGVGRPTCTPPALTRPEQRLGLAIHPVTGDGNCMFRWGLGGWSPGVWVRGGASRPPPARRAGR
jgi:hypothetical protein